MIITKHNLDSEVLTAGTGDGKSQTSLR